MTGLGVHARMYLQRMSKKADTGWPDYLRRAMESAGHTATSLARAIGASPSVVSRWLSGETQTEVFYLRRLSAVFHVPVIDLLVAAGHLEPDDVRMRERPKPPASPEDLLERYLQEFIPAAARDTVRAMVKPLEKDRAAKGDRKIG